MMVLNVGLLEATMTQIRDHPELHHQDAWFTDTDCGTAMCFAGWACALSGMPQLRNDSSVSASAVQTPWGVDSAGNAARKVLGLNEHQSKVLFGPGNSEEILEAMCKDLINTGDLRSEDSYLCGDE